MKSRLPTVKGQVTAGLHGGPGHGERVTLERLMPWLHYVPQTTVTAACPIPNSVMDEVALSTYRLVEANERHDAYYEYVTEDEAANSSG